MTSRRPALSLARIVLNCSAASNMILASARFSIVKYESASSPSSRYPILVFSSVVVATVTPSTSTSSSIFSTDLATFRSSPIRRSDTASRLMIDSDETDTTNSRLRTSRCTTRPLLVSVVVQVSVCLFALFSVLVYVFGSVFRSMWFWTRPLVRFLTPPSGFDAHLAPDPHGNKRVSHHPRYPQIHVLTARSVVTHEEESILTLILILSVFHEQGIDIPEFGMFLTMQEPVHVIGVKDGTMKQQLAIMQSRNRM